MPEDVAFMEMFLATCYKKKKNPEAIYLKGAQDYFVYDKP